MSSPIFARTRARLSSCCHMLNRLSQSSLDSILDKRPVAFSTSNGLNSLVGKACVCCPIYCWIPSPLNLKARGVKGRSFPRIPSGRRTVSIHPLLQVLSTDRLACVHNHELTRESSSCGNLSLAVDERRDETKREEDKHRTLFFGNPYARCPGCCGNLLLANAFTL
jgi:hypothetical protein